MPDIIVPVTFKSDYAARILDAVNTGAEKKCTIVIRDKDDIDFSCSWNFNYDPKSAEETNIQYGSRFFASFLRAFVRAIEYRVSCKEREAAVDAIPAPSVNVPDAIVE